MAKAVVDIGREDFATGLAFVEFSRVRTVEDFVMRQDFLPERLRDTKAIEARIEEEMRLAVLADAMSQTYDRLLRYFDRRYGNP